MSQDTFLPWIARRRLSRTVRAALLRTARVVLMLAFGVASPSLGGAFRCCSDEGPVRAPVVTHHDESSTASHAPALADETHHSQSAPGAAPCTCFANCHAARVDVTLPTVTEVIATEALEETRTPVAPGAGPRDQIEAFHIPFGNGPPIA